MYDGFTVSNPSPTITAVLPVSGYIPGPVAVTITGSKFVSGLGVSLVNESLSIPGKVSGFTSTKFTGTFDLAGADPGRYNLTVTNPGGPNATKPNAFTVNSPSDNPTITNCSPASGVNIAAQPFVVNGTNFRAGATVTISNGSATKTVPATPVTGYQIKCSLPLTGLSIGLYNLTVVNTDGTNATEPGAFTVMNPSPSIAAVTPASGYNTGTIPVTITGTKFVPGASIILSNQTRNISGDSNLSISYEYQGFFLSDRCDIRGIQPDG